LKQVSEDNRPDFLPGGYMSSELVFFRDGTLKVTRTFGDGSLSMAWRVGYEWNEDQTELTLGRIPENRPDEELLRGFTARRGKIRVTSATQSFPVALKCKQLANGNTQLDDREYAPDDR